MILLLFALTTVLAFIHPPDVQDKILTTNCGSEQFSEKTECYFVIPEDDIYAFNLDNPPFSNNSIFFIETSCSGGLNYLQACSVESAARAHPDRDINVLFPGPVAQFCLKISPLWDILKYHNVRLYRIHIVNYIKKTPISNFLSSTNFLQSHFPVYHVSDILRFVTLYKYGGVYSDLDVIVTKSFDSLPVRKNWVGVQKQGIISTALLALTKEGTGHNIAKETLLRLQSDFQPYSMEYNSIEIFKKVIQIICGKDDVRKISAETCKGFHVYEPEYFYSISYSSYQKYFDTHDGRLPKKPFAFHLWNHMTQGLTIYNDSFLSFLLDAYCPKVAALMH